MFREQRNLSINNATNGVSPKVTFFEIKNFVLGENYDLSLAFITPKEARRVTHKHRGYDKASNVLSFPLSETSGEILICLATARREAREHSIAYTDFVAYLFIHGMLHLQGQDHSLAMTNTEHSILKEFNISLSL